MQLRPGDQGENEASMNPNRGERKRHAGVGQGEKAAAESAAFAGGDAEASRRP